MTDRARFLQPCIFVHVLLVLSVAREASGWLLLPGRGLQQRSSRVSLCTAAHLGESTQRQRSHHHPLLLNQAPPRNGTPRSFSSRLPANTNDGGDGGDGGREQQQRKVQSAEDEDAPILYIKGLNDGGGVGVWGENGGGGAREAGGGNAAIVAEAMRRAELGGEEEEEAEVEGGGGADEVPVWEKVQRALGLGTWSYVGLGLALFIIALNNTLGLGWLSRAFMPDFDTEGLVDVERQQPQIQVLPLDGPSNLLSP